MKNLSESVDIKIMDGKQENLEQWVQEQWKTLENKWAEKIVHPEDKEAVICQAEFRIRRAVQKDEDERWKNRMANEDKITVNATETLRSDLTKMSAKMAEEVVFLKNRHQGSAASTVYGSTGSGGSVGHFASRTVQNTFVASRIGLKGWGSWRNIKGTGISLEETKTLISTTKARLRLDEMNVFDWDLIDRDQGIFDTKMMVFQ